MTKGKIAFPQSPQLLKKHQRMLMLSWTIDHKETPSEIIQSVPNSDTHKKIAYVPILHFQDVFSDPNQDTPPE